MKFNIKDDNRGLTLLELLVGVVILAIIFTPLLHVFITGANTTRKSKLYSDAALAAQNTIEEIEAAPIKKYLEDAGVIDGDDPDHGKYDIIKEQVPNGGSKLDAKITIEAINSTKIPLSNQMDARFSMQEVDTTAYELFKDSGGFTKLSRYITIDVDEIDTKTCKVTVTFNYSGSVKKTRTDSAGNTYNEDLHYSYPVISEMNVTPNSYNAFSIYLFFKAYESIDKNFIVGKTVINNNTKCNFNVFLVDVNDHDVEDGIGYDVEYKPKVEGSRANLLTNMKNVTYKVYKNSDSIWQTPEDVEPCLVEMDSVNRLYNINVEIYKHDPEHKYKNKLLSMETNKLDYSTKHEGGSA